MYTWVQAVAVFGAPTFLNIVLKKDGGAAGENSKRFRNDSRVSPLHSLVAIDLQQGGGFDTVGGRQGWEGGVGYS